MSCQAIQIIVSPQQQDNPPAEPSPGPPDWVSDALRERLRRVRDELPVNYPMPHRADEPVKVAENDPETPTHVRSLHHLPESTDEKAHVEKLKSDIVADAKWYRIIVGTCHHDENTGAPCERYVAAEYGNVPDGVPGG